LLPPSSQFLQQKRLKFAQQHDLSITGMPSPPVPSAISVLESVAQADLSGELHEVLILWRARIHIHLAQHEQAVDDLEFYRTSLFAGETENALRSSPQPGSIPPASRASTNNVRGARRRRAVDQAMYDAVGSALRAGGATHGLGFSDEFSSDEQGDGDDDSKIDDLLKVSLGLGDALAATGTAAATATASIPTTDSTVASSAHAQQAPSLDLATRVLGSTASNEELTHSFGFGDAAQEERYLHARSVYDRHARMRHSRLLCYLGSLYHVRRRDADALRCYSASIALDGNNLYALLNRALVSRLQGRFSNAMV
jgi:hypothetical protein